MAALTDEYGWGPTEWKRLTVWEFRGWVREANRRGVEREKERARLESEMRRNRRG